MAKEPKFENYISSERTRLTTAREEVQKRIGDAQVELAEIDKELAAISAYEAAKAGKPITIGKPRTPSTGPREPRGKRQEAILAAVKIVPGGLTRGEIIDAIGVKGQKGAEQSVSNALNNMKKSGKLDTKDGKYILAGA